MGRMGRLRRLGGLRRVGQVRQVGQVGRVGQMKRVRQVRQVGQVGRVGGRAERAFVRCLSFANCSLILRLTFGEGYVCDDKNRNYHS